MSHNSPLSRQISITYRENACNDTKELMSAIYAVLMSLAIYHKVSVKAEQYITAVTAPIDPELCYELLEALRAIEKEFNSTSLV